MNNNEKGFTLIEVILAVALIAIIMLMFSSLFNNSLFLSSKSQQIDNSSSEAQSKIELNNGTFVEDKDITFTFSGNTINGEGSVIESTTSDVDYSVVIYEGSSFNETGWSTSWENMDD
jgi:prepilin-type N-terminal cleavage/methylation domain-containing protein